jgi:glycosyltransferase involved in cell wall biosynthesis
MIPRGRADGTTPPRLSVVIATKDRPRALARLLDCVKRQSLRDIEVIVVDDGSTPEVVAEYGSIWSGLDERFQLRLDLRGGGPGGSRNAGICLAQGEFVAFCDDDDIWLRDDHLETAVAALTQHDGDLYFANMQTSADQVVLIADWYGKGGGLLQQRPLNAERTLFEVGPRHLARFLRHRHLHANTLVLRKELMIRIGLYWDKIGFSEDNDLSFRLADASYRTLYCALVAADLDTSEHPSIARRYDLKERLLFDIVALLHAECHVRNRRLRAGARRNRAGRLAHLSELLLAEGMKQQALSFALQSAMTSPSLGTIRNLCRVLLRGLRTPRSPGPHGAVTQKPARPAP